MLTETTGPGLKDDVVVPRPRPWRWVGRVLAVVIVASVLYSFTTNANYQWDVVRSYLFDSRILDGLRTTLVLTAVGMVIAGVLGLLLAVMRLSDSALVRSCAGAYIWLFRGTPVLVQLILWYNLAILLPEVKIGVPFGPTLWSAEMNTLITPWTAAILGLALNEAAYLGEIVRSGILAVERGQTEAAHALGLSGGDTFRKIVLPQALRVIVPPAFNELIGLLKYSSVVSVIALPELLYSGQLIYGRTYETIPVLLVVCIWYLVVVTVLTALCNRLERRLGAGFHPGGGAAPTNSGRWSRWIRRNP
ncbi:amino acid ABC transporter permease [Kineosporia succinea]|uniref:Polar amino acid transport system permease protein n=1 Tax=Kineosporia succinea TaxID=84632 RepID=A0ABT9PDY7_9ACTN|nr:amino acid ABC transporter permease [Kineosporia succinea]MDP9830916.1 polar amino acid transport system permease protein [Kineosporia succinea]